MFPILDTNLCPFPKVTWWRDHALLDSTDSNQASFKTENELSLKDLKRSDLHSILTCQASNNNISVPVSTSVKLDMNCKYIFRQGLLYLDGRNSQKYLHQTQADF